MDLITDLQGAVVERLLGGEFWQLHPALRVVAQNAADFRSVIEESLGRLGGMVCQVGMRSAATGEAQMCRPRLREVPFFVRVRELIELNRGAGGSGQTAEMVASAVAVRLHGWTPRDRLGRRMAAGAVEVQDTQWVQDGPGIYALDVLATVPGSPGGLGCGEFLEWV